MLIMENSRHKIQTVLNLIFIAALTVLGWFVFQHQQIIARLEMSENPATENNFNEGSPASLFYQTEGVRKALIDSKMVMGTIQEIKNGTFTLSAEIVDLEKLAERENYSVSGEIPEIKKMYTVVINKTTKTNPPSLKEALKTGDQVVVYALESPYLTSKLTAVTIDTFSQNNNIQPPL